MCPDMEKGRLTSARSLPGSSFVNQALRDQFLHQDTNYATRHLHTAGQVSTRDRLMLPDQIQGDVTIYVAGSCARGDFKISGIDLTHWGPRFEVLFELRTISPIGRICQD